jgi:hypothetical protein
VIDVSERVLSALPLRGPQARWSARLEERKVDVDRASTYVELYGAYAETEASFAVDRLLERWESLDEATGRRSASTRGSSTGSSTSPPSTCRRWSPTHG